jgi:hypothetical protein
LTLFFLQKQNNETPVTFQFQGHRRAQFNLFDRPFGIVSFETGFRSDIHIVFFFQQFFGFIRCEQQFPIKQDHFDISKMFILQYKKTLICDDAFICRRCCYERSEKKALKHPVRRRPVRPRSGGARSDGGSGSVDSPDERDVHHLGFALAFPGQIVGGQRHFLDRREDAAVSGENVAQRTFRRDAFVLDTEDLRERALK